MTVATADEFDFDRYGSIRERDIDLVVCIAAATIPRVWRLFGDDDEAPRTSHSVSTSTGEIDVVLSWPGGATHIENKIDAPFQPDQAERYRARARSASLATSTLLLAPSAYLRTHTTEAQLFDSTVSYQQLVKALKEDSSTIAGELALLVEHGIEQHRRGRDGEVSEARTKFFREFAARAVKRNLPFDSTVERGPQSGFFYAHSWDSVEGHKVELVAKFEHFRTVDLQITDAGHIHTRVAELLEPEGITVDATRTRTGRGTLILGRPAPSLDPDKDIADQEDAVRKFLDVAVKHQTWWQEDGKRLIASALDQA